MPDADTAFEADAFEEAAFTVYGGYDITISAQMIALTHTVNAQCASDFTVTAQILGDNGNTED